MQEHPTVTRDYIDTSHINIVCQKTHHTQTHKKQLQSSSQNFSTSKSGALEEPSRATLKTSLNIWWIFGAFWGPKLDLKCEFCASVSYLGLPFPVAFSHSYYSAAYPNVLIHPPNCITYPHMSIHPPDACLLSNVGHWLFWALPVVSLHGLSKVAWRFPLAVRSSLPWFLVVCRKFRRLVSLQGFKA